MKTLRVFLLCSLVVVLLGTPLAAQGQQDRPRAETPRGESVRRQPAPDSHPEAPTKAEPGPVAEAAVLRLIRFSGALHDAAGKPACGRQAACTGTVGITFALYKEQNGGAPLWLETQNVEPGADGRYTVLLGATHNDGLPLEIFTTEEARWLGIQVQGEEEQARILLVSVPYALKAADAERLGGKPAEAFLLAESSGENSDEGGSGQGRTLSKGGDGTLAQVVSGTVGQIAKFTATDTVQDSIITETGGADIGVGTTTPLGKLHVQKTGALTKLVVGNPSVVGNNASDGFIQIFGEHNGVVKSGFLQNVGDSLQLNGAGSGVNIQLLGQSETSILNGTSLGVYDSTNAKRLYIRHDGTRVLFSTFGTNAGGMAFRPVANLTNAFQFQVAGGATTVMNIDTTNQRVGIGTTAPTAKLEVGGQVKITGGSPGAGKVLTSDAGGLASWATPAGGVGGSGTATRVAFWDTASTLSSNASLFWDDTNSRLGIGTASPVTNLDVETGTSTNLRIQGGLDDPSAAILDLFEFNPIGDTGFQFVYDGSNNRLDTVARLSGGSGTVMSILRNNGFVGIGTTAPSEMLDITGNLKVGGKVKSGNSRSSVVANNATSTSSTTLAQVPNMIVTVTTGGGPLLVLGNMGAVAMGSGTQACGLFQLVLDGSTVLDQQAIIDGGSEDSYPITLMALTTPSAGSHTFTVTWVACSGTTVNVSHDAGGTLSPSNRTLLVLEL